MQKVILITFYFDSRNYVATTKDKTFGYCRETMVMVRLSFGN